MKRAEMQTDVLYTTGSMPKPLPTLKEVGELMAEFDLKYGPPPKRYLHLCAADFDQLARLCEREELPSSFMSRIGGLTVLENKDVPAGTGLRTDHIDAKEAIKNAKDADWIVLGTK